MKKSLRILISLSMLSLTWSCTDDVVSGYDIHGNGPVRPHGNQGQEQQGGEEEGQQQNNPPEEEAFISAAEAVKNMGAGWNLGNTLDSNSGDTEHMWIEAYGRNVTPKDYETAWGQPVTTRALIHMFKAAGFNAIRVPVTWYPHMGKITLHDNEKWDMATGWSGTDVDPPWMNRVQETVDYVIDEGMYCILNDHHDTGAASTAWLVAGEEGFEAAKSRYQALWKQIAERFRDYGPRLLFESYNEMLDKYDSWCFASFASPARYDAADAESAYKGINSYAKLFVETVRNTGGNNAERNLVVNTYGACSGDGTWNSHLLDPLKNMDLPEYTTPGHIAIQVHSYWETAKFGASMQKDVDQLFSNLDTYIVKRLGVPVIIGEWGDSGSATDAQIAKFSQYFCTKAKENSVAPFMWMCLSDGKDREVPKWTMPNTKDAIISAYK